MKIEIGDGLDIFGTIEVNHAGQGFLFEGPDTQSLRNIIESMGYSYPGDINTNPDAYLEWLTTKLINRLWARPYGTQSGPDRPGKRV